MCLAQGPQRSDADETLTCYESQKLSRMYMCAGNQSSDDIG